MRGDNRGDEKWFQRGNEVDEGFEGRQSIFLFDNKI